MARQKAVHRPCGSAKIFLISAMLVLLVLSAVIVSADPNSPTTRLLPDTAGIDGQLTANLHVEQFFSLWLVFHNDDVQVSDQAFTIFAPLNAATKDTSYLRNPENVKQLLLNHVILGTALTVRNISTEQTFTTLTGKSIRITRRGQKIYANDALIIEPKVEVPGGILVIIDNYVVGNEAFNASHPPENIPINLLTTITDVDKTANMPNVNNNTKFIENIHQVLSFLKNGVRVFQHFLSKSNVTKLLSNGQEYTVLVPTDHAFQRWHPIDWGFYPFSVPEFTEDIIRNHFIIGNLRQNDIKDGGEVKTLGGRVLKFNLKPMLAVNGVYVVKGDTPVNGGNIMFINEVLFVSESVVSRLHQQHRDKETPPLLAFPWFGAQFLSHAFLALERDRRFSHITRFLNLADLAPHVSGTGYTFFVPTDTAFESIGLSKMPDNYLSTGDGLHLLLNHFVKRRLYQKDLQNNTTLLSLANETITISRKNGNIILNGAHIVESEVFVYNLGTMYYIDKLLFNISNVSIKATTIASPTRTTDTMHSELVPEEVIEEAGTLPDVLLEATASDDKSTFQVPTITNKINSSDPIK